MSIFSSVGPVVAIGGLLVSSITGVGTSAHQEHASNPSNDRTVIAVPAAPSIGAVKYTDSDIVEFFVWGRGPAAVARPDLLATLGITPQSKPTPSVLATTVADFKAVDSHFHGGVTLALQAHDPYRTQSGIEEFSTDIQTLVAHSSPNSSPTIAAASRAVPDGSVYGSTNYLLFTQVAVSAALVLAVAGVVSIGVVFLAFYQKPADQSNLIAQTYADALSQL
jgi:hypothetical protein